MIGVTGRPINSYKLAGGVHEQLYYGVFDDELYQNGKYDPDDDYIFDDTDDDDETSKE